VIGGGEGEKEERGALDEKGDTCKQPEKKTGGMGRKGVLEKGGGEERNSNRSLRQGAVKIRVLEEGKTWKKSLRKGRGGDSERSQKGQIAIWTPLRGAKLVKHLRRRKKIKEWVEH